MRRKNSLLKLIILVISIIIIAILGFWLWYRSCIYSPVDKKSEEPIRVEIKEGMSNRDIADLLDKSKVIKSAFALRLYMKNNHLDSLKAGKYNSNSRSFS